MSDYDSDDDIPPTLVELAPETPAPAVEEVVPTATNKATASEPLSACPVTILSGFLGSGKTTLIQYILQSPDHHKRIAVIENEFGEGLEIESIIARDGADKNNSSLSDLIELPNGCVCCTVKDSLVECLENLLDKRQDLDYIIIECSGMANPGPLASMFWLDDALESRIRLDGIVTLVDSVRIRQQLETTEEAAQQLAYADRILLNKMDLLQQLDDSSSRREEITSTIRAINPTAKWQSTQFSRVPDLDWILDAKCYTDDDAQQPARVTEQVEQLIADLQNDDNHHSHSHEHEHSHHHSHDHEDCAQCNPPPPEEPEPAHKHTSAVSTIALTEVGTVDWHKINAWLAATLWPNQDEKDHVLRARLEQSLAEQQQQQSNGNEKSTQRPTSVSSSGQQIFRIKGLLSVKQTPETVADPEEWERYCDPTTGVDQRRFILQAVYDLWEIHASQNGSDALFDDDKEEERCCKVVVIGRHLQRAEDRKSVV